MLYYAYAEAIFKGKIHNWPSLGKIMDALGKVSFTFEYLLDSNTYYVQIGPESRDQVMVFARRKQARQKSCVRLRGNSLFFPLLRESGKFSLLAESRRDYILGSRGDFPLLDSAKNHILES